jgi:RIO kinase 1
MKIPARLQMLLNEGILDQVLYPLMSGKEAAVFAVLFNGQIRCAKVYKEAQTRSFKRAVTYLEGRNVRSSRRQRAMNNASRFGRQEAENAWQTAECEALNRVAQMGVPVPRVHGAFDGVILMDLICTADGEVAPRLNDAELSIEQAREDHVLMVHYIMRMLCAGLIHGDLSEFNVLQDDYGPVIIDLPQAINAASHPQAKQLLLRDVDNITRYYSQYIPELASTRYGEEMWAHYELGDLHEDLILTGRFVEDEKTADVRSVMREIRAAEAEEAARIARLQEVPE